ILAAMILLVTLGERNAPLAVDLLQRAGGVERREAWADQISIEARARADASGELAAVAEIHRNRIVGMPRSDDHRRFHFAVADGQLNDVGLFEAKLGERGAGDNRGVIPAQAGDRLGQLLPPARGGAA